MKRTLFALAIASVLAACGGGGGGDDDTPVQAQAFSTSICLHGNSVLRGSYVPTPGNVVRSAYAPETVLGWNFPTATIRDYSVNGEAVWGMRASANWPRQNCTRDVFLHYHNDGPDFEAQLNLALNEMTAPVKMLVIANLPTLAVNPAWTYIATNAETVRRVAGQRGIKLCDANLGTTLNHADGIHPDDTGYAVLSGAIVRCLKETGL